MGSARFIKVEGIPTLHPRMTQPEGFIGILHFRDGQIGAGRKEMRSYCIMIKATQTANSANLNPTSAASVAAAALRRLPRDVKRPWTGWLHGKHLRRDDLVILPDGRVGRIYGAVRGSVIVWKDPIPETGLPAEIFRAEDLRAYKNPHAVVLGSLKRGSKEAPSNAKREACRRNGSKPPRPGSRPRGRPREQR